MKFECKSAPSATGPVLSFIGHLTEDADLARIPLTPGVETTIDMAAVTGINSIGINAWIRWILNHKTAELRLLNCPRPIVDQMNMVKGFVNDRVCVGSFFVPFFSPATGEEKNVLFTQGREFTTTGQVNIPSVFDSKGNAMELDINPLLYFRFLNALAHI